MSKDREYDLSKKTWTRSIEPVTKIGFMDGASDGQAAMFQQSFNVGYEQGLNFGLELGFREARFSMQQQRADIHEPQDQHRMNCQICANGVKLQENIGNLYNIQKEKNAEYLRCNKD